MRTRGFGADREAAREVRAGFGAATGLATAVVLSGRSGAAVAAAASTFLRACFAAFFSILSNFRACLSCALADRTSSLAAVARAAAFAAASFNLFRVVE